MPSIKNLINKKFGRLLVLKYTGQDDNNNAVWSCLCDCGNIKNVGRQPLVRGTTKSCGCIKKEKITKRNKNNAIHNMSKTKFHRVWLRILARCNCKNKEGYKHYGGRGISYDPRWEDFLEFKKDMYQAYVFAKKKYRKTLKRGNPISIERINVNGNYCKENCCWIPMSEQAGNRQNNKWFKAISPKGKEYIHNNITKLAKFFNLNQSSVHSCLINTTHTHKGWFFYYLSEEEVNETKKHNACWKIPNI